MHGNRSGEPQQQLSTHTNPGSDTTIETSKPAGPDWTDILQRHAEGDKAAFREFLGSITPDNTLSAWQAARKTRLTPTDRGNLYTTLGKVGGGTLVTELMAASDPNAALAVQGWGHSDPTGALEWFQQIDLHGDKGLQKYLSASNQTPEGFLDKIADGLLNSLHPTPDPSDTETTREAYSAETLRFVESLMEQDPGKGEAVMRELTERLIQLYDGNTLADWVNQMESPVIKSASVQRIIEAGTFKSAPLEAVDWAYSLEAGRTREVGLSAAFGQLGSGVGGTDPAAIANQLNQMPEGREKDFAINGFAHGLVGNSPNDALTWAGSISDENFRNTVTENINRRIKSQTTADHAP